MNAFKLAYYANIMHIIETIPMLQCAKVRFKHILSSRFSVSLSVVLGAMVRIGKT